MSDMELAVFARAPKAGQVKTRLAPLLGESGALQAHRELVVGTLARIASIPEISLWVSAIDDEVLQWAERVGGSLSLQHGDHLGNCCGPRLLRPQPNSSSSSSLPYNSC